MVSIECDLGNWTSINNSVQLDYLTQTKGAFNIVFFLTLDTNHCYAIAELIDGYYADQKIVQIQYNISDPMVFIDANKSEMHLKKGIFLYDTIEHMEVSNKPVGVCNGDFDLKFERINGDFFNFSSSNISVDYCFI